MKPKIGVVDVGGGFRGIYAAGVLYNVMLTGKHPNQQFARGRAGQIVRKCTELNPADRYRSAEDLAARL